MTEVSSMIISHKKVCIKDMESAWHGGLDDLLEHLMAHQLVEECAVVKTCNRVEIYVVSLKGSKVLLNFAKQMNVSSRIMDFLDHDESLLHLLRVSSGLESMIIGEDQILGQVKELYSFAKKTGATGRMLDTAFSKAIQVGKRVRKETNINKGSVSIGSAAVELAEDVFGDLTGKNIMVIGAGEMGTLVAKSLAGKHLNVEYVANRTFERAKKLAEELGGVAVPYDKLVDYTDHCDAIISATSAPHSVLTREMMLKVMSRRDRKIVLIDIGNPRNIDPGVASIENVVLHNIDDLKSISNRNLQQRKEEAKKAEKIIEEELRLLKMQYKRQKADKLISALYSKVEEIRRDECRAAVNKLSAYHTMGEIEEKVLYNMTHSFSNQILAEPTKVLRRAAEHDDERLLEIVTELFKLDGSREQKR
ncbi:MAG: Glutamyl-tRNA reductase [Candidatus Argoarchaeum ethanivorans]|uniref:Glutamyl-tRNA reductase n=1 Tax=Candidatus Argoarchaeum ethanivorans TaxID=2608793 RepID=A0A811TCD0_9EURY|nr:MAG: Glutamyl-tRNA reductase [Candidatus Argoarchaeum ethanivorans]CAD6492415.1 MAG: Glutamyl-tRNA reductase [Candidatus Argoarchaeum ethanivorans]